MAAHTVAVGTDWIDTMVLGQPGERWRLDDYDIWMHVKRAGQSAALVELGLDGGGIRIVDPVLRRVEVNVGWSALPLTPGSYEFDFLMQNRTTGIRVRSAPQSLTVARGITLETTP